MMRRLYFSPGTSSHHKPLPSDAMRIVYILCPSCSELDLNIRWSRKQSLSASADEFAPNDMTLKSMSVFLLIWYKMAGNQVHARHKDIREQRKPRLEGGKPEESSGGRGSFLSPRPFAAADVNMMSLCPFILREKAAIGKRLSG